MHRRRNTDLSKSAYPDSQTKKRERLFRTVRAFQHPPEDPNADHIKQQMPDVGVADSVSENSPQLEISKPSQVQREEVGHSAEKLTTHHLPGGTLQEVGRDANSNDPLNGPAILSESSRSLHRGGRLVTNVVAIVDAHRILPSCGTSMLRV